jgi:DNA repair exonuclease SbcCD ATPase subunit
MVEDDAADVGALQKKRQTLANSIEVLIEKIQLRTTEISKYTRQVTNCESELRVVRAQLAQAEKGAKEEAQRNERLADDKEKARTGLQSTKKQLKVIQAALKELDVRVEMLDYAKKSFSRNGLPMYIAASLCPLLNKAADEYSELFNDGKIKVRFAVREGEFTVDIVNPAGSGEAEGQSVGEAARAGIVAAFALREAAPKTNLLILDEPGHGLDSEGAKRFAEGLLKLKDRFETILCTTHHPAIEAILSGEKIWTVTKKRGLSQLTTA